LITALKDPDASVRFAAVTSLGAIRDPIALEPLSRTLRIEGDYSVRVAAIKSLGKLQIPGAVPVLIDSMLKFQDEAAAALVGMGDLAIGPLIEELHSARLKNRAAELLATIGGPAVAPLIETFRHDEDKYARLTAARALAEIQDRRAENALDEALKTGDSELVAATYTFLIRKGQPGTEKSLTGALNEYGRIPMAKDFVISGNPVLKASGEAWLNRKQFEVTISPDRA
jgi:HEAT repeat protein